MPSESLSCRDPCVFGRHIGQFGNAHLLCSSFDLVHSFLPGCFSFRSGYLMGLNRYSCRSKNAVIEESFEESFDILGFRVFFLP